jgi:hypothetical protein
MDWLKSAISTASEQHRSSSKRPGLYNQMGNNKTTKLLPAPGTQAQSPSRLEHRSTSAQLFCRCQCTQLTLPPRVLQHGARLTGCEYFMGPVQMCAADVPLS